MQNWRAKRATHQGIDVSVHNGAVDMAKVKAAGKDFIMIRSSFGDVISYPKQIDKRFESNFANAKKAGLNIGLYHYMYATGTAGAEREAKGFLQAIKGKVPLAMPVALDIEEQAQYKLSRTTLEAIIKAFIDVVEKAGYFCALYSYEAFFSKLSSSFRSKYAIWCANTSRTPSIAYGIHQYSFVGKVDGISGSVDLNRTSVDYPAKIKAAGLNGYTKNESVKVLDETGFKTGDNNIGSYALKQLLILGGAKLDDNAKIGEGSTAAINARLKAWGYAQNSTAGLKFIKKLRTEIQK